MTSKSNLLSFRESKIVAALIFALILCLSPQIVRAEFLGVKKVTEPIVFPINGPIDTLGRQTLQYATPDHPDSITVFTYLDDGTFIAWDSGGAAYACPGVDTTSRRGETEIWFNRKIHWIDGIPADSNSYTLAVTVWVWEDGYYRETNATVQVVTDSLNQLYTVRDTLQVYDNAGKFQALVQQILDTLQVYDNAGQFQAEIASILSEVTNLDGGTIPWNATTMDSVLQALDYTNNRHNVIRNNQGDTVGYANITGTALSTSIVQSLQSEAITNGSFALGAIDANAVEDGAINAGELGGTAAREIADSIWMARVSKYKTQSTYTTAAFRDSVFAAAYTVGTTGNMIVGMRPNLDSAQGDLADAQIATLTTAPDLDAATGTLANSQVDLIDVTFLNDSLALILSRLAALITDTSQALSANDSALVSRIFGRKVWGVAAGEAGSSDSTALAARFVQRLATLDEDNTTIDLDGSTIGTALAVTLVNGIASGAIDSADIDANVYTYIAGLLSDSTWRKSWVFATSTAGSVGAGLDAIRDSMDEAAAAGSGATDSQVRAALHDSVGGGQAASLVSDPVARESDLVCLAGSGAVYDTVWARDTSGTDMNIPYVTICATNSSGAQLGECGETGANGSGPISIPQSASVTFSGFRMGYYWNPRTITSTSGTHDNDTIFGYNLVIAAPTGPQLKPVYGYEYKGGVADSGRVVRATLIRIGHDTADYLVDTALGATYRLGMVLSDTTDGNGQWTLYCPLNSNMKQDSTRWHFRAIGAWDLESIPVNLTDTTTNCLPAITGRGDCP
jgi:hypothetical protein